MVEKMHRYEQNGACLEYARKSAVYRNHVVKENLNGLMHMQVVEFKEGEMEVNNWSFPGCIIFYLEFS